MKTTEKLPSIAAFRPVVLGDKRRVRLEMTVENLPTSPANVMLTIPDTFDPSPSRPPKPDPNAPNPYPNVELSILNGQRQQLASLLIVEHKEPHTALTLHIPVPDLQEKYTARAEMVHNNQVLDVVEVPFTLNQGNKTDG